MTTKTTTKAIIIKTTTKQENEWQFEMQNKVFVN